MGWIYIGEAVSFTPHARARCQQRGVSLAEAATAVCDFDVSEAGRSECPGREVRTRGDVSVVFESARQLILTVWRTPGRGGQLEGAERRAA
jgi:hypothetical protein